MPSSTQTFAVGKSSEGPVWLPLQLENTPLYTLQSVDLPTQSPVVSIERNNLNTEIVHLVVTAGLTCKVLAG